MGRERGATLVEAAIAIPIIFLLIFGLVEFGRFIAVTSTVTNASREAARYATTSGDGPNGVPRYVDCGGIHAAAVEFSVIGTPDQLLVQYDTGPGSMPRMDIDCNDPSTTLNAGDIADGDRVIVEARTQFQTIVPLISGFLGPTTVSETTIRTINKGS